MSNEEFVQAAVRIIMDATLDLIQGDPHQWSTRPCPTCRTVSKMMGKNFGCYRYAEARKPTIDSKGDLK